VRIKTALLLCEGNRFADMNAAGDDSATKGKPRSGIRAGLSSRQRLGIFSGLGAPPALASKLVVEIAKCNSVPETEYNRLGDAVCNRWALKSPA
jgi:hypothetical protein